MDGRNEKRADATRDRPSSNPAVMVMPEREVPGTRASTCMLPIATGTVAAAIFSSSSAGASNLRWTMAFHPLTA